MQVKDLLTKTLSALKLLALCEVLYSNMLIPFNTLLHSLL